MRRQLSSMLTSTRALILSALRTLLKGPSVLQSLLAIWLSPVRTSSFHRRTLADYTIEIEDAFTVALEPGALMRLSLALERQYKQSLQSDMRCMLPSYNHQLPYGHETGTFLALDVGGSTFRVALIELRGQKSEDPMRIISLQSWKIDNAIKALRGHAFFDWMASKIAEVVERGREEDADIRAVLPMGLAWSFPIESVSTPLYLRDI
jgi:hexokinase